MNQALVLCAGLGVQYSISNYASVLPAEPGLQGSKTIVLTTLLPPLHHTGPHFDFDNNS
jgi:hypothetical protein